jgi:hexosaminidase
MEAVRRATAGTLKIDSAARATGNIVLRLDTKLFPELSGWQRAESYKLTVTGSGVELAATAQQGLFNGAQTLAQLIQPAGKAEWQLPACEVKDYPRFQWRGLLLDPARHFLSPDYLKKFIDLMACYKYNRLQLHLTDDPGWRIEIKKDPRLTQIGSVRKQSPKRGDRDHGDGQVYGPFFYSQAQIRELVAYALARNVVLVPEIEIPGHFGAAIASHPELSCSGKISDDSSAWGINGGILCPGNDAGVAFTRTVLGEVCDLFPSEFIHIGGDEVPRERWKTCSKCQARMKAEGLKNEAQLQTWLNHRLEEFLTSKGRRMIGWDEILEGGLTPGAVVMPQRPGTTSSCRPRRIVTSITLKPKAPTSRNASAGSFPLRLCTHSSRSHRNSPRRSAAIFSERREISGANISGTGRTWSISHFRARLLWLK